MKRKKALFAALLAFAVMALSVPSAAQAQQQETGQVNFGSLISALNNINANIQDVQALNDLTVEDVRVVSADNLLKGANINALNKALQNADIDALQNFLNDNEIIKNALNQNNVALEDVVAIDVLSGGEVVVFLGPTQEG